MEIVDILTACSKLLRMIMIYNNNIEITITTNMIKVLTACSKLLPWHTGEKPWLMPFTLTVWSNSGNLGNKQW